MKKFSFLVLIFTQCLAIQALKPVVIEGTAAFAKGGKIRFYVYNDLLLQQRILLKEAAVSKDGNFRAELQINETCLLSMAYNTNYGSIYVEPEKKYTIELLADEEILPYINAEMMGNGIRTKILPVDTTELNYKISRFDRYYNYFWQLFGENLMSHPPETYDSLKQLLTSRFPYKPDATDYYSVYLKYRMAYIDLLYYQKDRDKLFDKYLNTKYIFYNNTAYMDFFDQYFGEYLYGGRKVTRQMLYQNINEKCDYYKLLDDLGKDPLLVNEVVREMVLIKGLGELYAMDGEFSQRNILILLKKMTQVSKFMEHRTMAENMINSLLNMQAGTTAPDFSLKNVHNATVNLSDFKGKYVYLHFFATYCEDCIREMAVLKQINDTYKDNLQIISIMLDFEQTKLYHFVTEYKEFGWLFLHFASNYEFLDAYKPYNLPFAVLINPEGLIVSAPAKSPMEDGFLRQIISLLPQKEQPRK
jgi:thiol-disulfide isomerase/thioredoxin